jgi:hypothetical protein
MITDVLNLAFTCKKVGYLAVLLRYINCCIYISTMRRRIVYERYSDTLRKKRHNNTRNVFRKAGGGVEDREIFCSEYPL